MFADDVLLFTKAAFSNLKTILAAFETYALIFGQEVNWDKSFIFLGSRVKRLTCYKLLHYTSMRHGGDSLTYLGALILKVCLKSDILGLLLTRFYGRLTLGRECVYPTLVDLLLLNLLL